MQKKQHFTQKEIEALNKVIAKTYQSINSTQDNMRMAAKLDTEVEELTKKAKALRSDSSMRS